MRASLQVPSFSRDPRRMSTATTKSASSTVATSNFGASLTSAVGTPLYAAPELLAEVRSQLRHCCWTICHVVPGSLQVLAYHPQRAVVHILRCAHAYWTLIGALRSAHACMRIGCLSGADWCLQSDGVPDSLMCSCSGMSSCLQATDYGPAIDVYSFVRNQVPFSASPSEPHEPAWQPEPQAAAASNIVLECVDRVDWLL